MLYNNQFRFSFTVLQLFLHLQCSISFFQFQYSLSILNFISYLQYSISILLHLQYSNLFFIYNPQFLFFIQNTQWHFSFTILSYIFHLLIHFFFHFQEYIYSFIAMTKFFFHLLFTWYFFSNFNAVLSRTDTVAGSLRPSFSGTVLHSSMVVPSVRCPHVCLCFVSAQRFLRDFFRFTGKVSLHA